MDILSLCTVHWKYTSHATFMSRGNLLSTRHVSVTNAGISALCLRTYIAYTMHGDTGLQTPPMRHTSSVGRKSNAIFALPGHGSTSSVGRKSNAIFGRKLKIDMAAYGWKVRTSPRRFCRIYLLMRPASVNSFAVAVAVSCICETDAPSKTSLNWL
ncbi:hypothetical protein Tco_0708370 [Tanacetum coccineum]